MGFFPANVCIFWLNGMWKTPIDDNGWEKPWKKGAEMWKNSLFNVESNQIVKCGLFYAEENTGLVFHKSRQKRARNGQKSWKTMWKLWRKHVESVCSGVCFCTDDISWDAPARHKL